MYNVTSVGTVPPLLLSSYYQCCADVVLCWTCCGWSFQLCCYLDCPALLSAIFVLYRILLLRVVLVFPYAIFVLCHVALLSVALFFPYFVLYCVGGGGHDFAPTLVSPLSIVPPVVSDRASPGLGGVRILQPKKVESAIFWEPGTLSHSHTLSLFHSLSTC